MKVKVCDNIMSGIRFMVAGIACCCANTWNSPIIISAEEMSSGNITHELIMQRRKDLFDALNGFSNQDAGACYKCGLVYETDIENVSFDKLGVTSMSSGFNISHYSACNMRCTYCQYTQEDVFVQPPYTNIIEFIEEFRTIGKIIPNTWIEFNGGEPTILKDFENILNYLVDNNIGQVCLFSNAVRYSNAIFNGLKQNKIFLTTSIDAGTEETFKIVRGVDCFHKVIDNVRKYRETHTDNLWLKYVICEQNKTEEDLIGFVELMDDIRPNKVYICPEFPYHDNQIPDSSAVFGARMWKMLEEKGLCVYIQSRDMKADPKFAKFTKDIEAEYERIK